MLLCFACREARVPNTALRERGSRTERRTGATQRNGDGWRERYSPTSASASPPKSITITRERERRGRRKARARWLSGLSSAAPAPFPACPKAPPRALLRPQRRPLLRLQHQPRHSGETTLVHLFHLE